MAKIWFVGAGPGDPDLFTVRGRDLLEQAGAVLYAGSLVSPAHLKFTSPGCVSADSSSMTMEQMVAWLLEQSKRCATVVRLQTGDPSLYGTLVEMVQPLDEAGVAVEVVPGVSSAFAAAAAAVESLTLPEVTQTVIFTRLGGRTPVPEKEQLADLARHDCSICIFLSITMLERVVESLLAGGKSPTTPILLVHKVSWVGEEKIIRGNLADIAEKCQQAGIKSQTMIIVGPTLNGRSGKNIVRSKLYDESFGHEFRNAKNIKK